MADLIHIMAVISGDGDRLVDAGTSAYIPLSDDTSVRKEFLEDLLKIGQDKVHTSWSKLC